MQTLETRQNADGGWPYQHGTSWTEPTAYAVLALSASATQPATHAGIRWLLAHQLPDGGWPPCPGIQESSWVTALVALIPPEVLGLQPHANAVRWLLGTTGRESTPLYRFREWLLGHATPPELSSPGWPWLPGAAAWVGPTSLALLALAKEQRRQPSDAAARRIEEGRHFLLNRMCKTGGWNHGSVRALGYEAEPYPETTGMALAALRGLQNPSVDRSVGVARHYLDTCRSADALNWLRLGLTAQKQLPAGFSPPPEIAYRTVPETALDLLASSAQQGRNMLWT